MEVLSPDIVTYIHIHFKMAFSIPVVTFFMFSVLMFQNLIFSKSGMVSEAKLMTEHSASAAFTLKVLYWWVSALKRFYKYILSNIFQSSTIEVALLNNVRVLTRMILNYIKQ